MTVRAGCDLNVSVWILLSDAKLGAMFDLRHLRRFGRLGRFLAVCLAYALAVQSVVASVGTGMSAFATPGQAGFVICGQMLLTLVPDPLRSSVGCTHTDRGKTGFELSFRASTPTDVPPLGIGQHVFGRYRQNVRN